MLRREKSCGRLVQDVNDQVVSRHLKLSILYFGILLLPLLIFAITSILFPNKFVRVPGSCSSNWIDLSDVPKDVASLDFKCCSPEYRSMFGMDNPPCYIGMDHSRIMTSVQGAWLIPLLSIIWSLFWTRFYASERQFVVACKRLALYLAIMAYRSFLVYPIVNYVEGLFYDRKNTNCVYSHLRPSMTCTPEFDSSDHIVLLMVHFLAIAFLELYSTEMEALSEDITRSSAHLKSLRAWFAINIALVMYFIYHTSLSFHRHLENVAAWIIAIVAVFVPLYFVFLRYPNVATSFRRHFVHVRIFKKL